MRILFVQTNTYRLLTPLPLGATLVAARLRRDGHELRFVDLMRDRHPARTVENAAREFRPELVCYSIRNRDNMDPDDYFDPVPLIVELIERVRGVAPAPILLGGTAFTTYTRRWMEATRAEWGMAGDDLEPIACFVGSLARGCPDLSTPGLVYHDARGTVVENPFIIVGYRGVRFDNYDLVDAKRYRWGHWQTAVITRSGCPDQCAYCDSFHTFGRHFIPREPAEVAADLLALKKTGRVRAAYLVDAGFNRQLDHAKEVLREILRQGAQLQLYSVFDPGFCDREFVELYRRAGGVAVMMFAESLADEVLRELNKPFTAGDIERDAAMLRQGRVAFTFRPNLGSPGETPATVAETFRRAEALKASMMAFRVGWRIQPRTPLFRRAVAEGLIAADDDCWEARYYVSPATPEKWLKQQIRRYRLRHPFLFLRAVPFIARAIKDMPWRRGPEAIERS